MSAPVVASAGIIASDDFDDYTNGALGGQGTAVYGWWAGNWVATAPFSVVANVTNTSITYTPPGGSGLGGGNSLSIAGYGTGILASRRLYAPQTNTFYAGMLVKWERPALNSGNSIALHLTDNETNVAAGFNFGLHGIWSTYGTSVRVGTNTPVAGAYKALPSQFATYYMVVKLEKTSGGSYNKITGWVDPNSSSESANPPGDIQLLVDSGVSNISTLVFRAGGFNSTAPNGPDFTLMDAVTLATTFADLMASAGSPPLDPDLVASVSVETRADGTGVLVSNTNLMSGQSITNYAIGRSTGGGFFTNLPATWVLTNVTGLVASGDLVPAPDGKSAIFTAGGLGSARILAVVNASNLIPSGVISALAPTNTSSRPFIWVRDSERAGILARIASSGSASSLANALVARAAADVSNYLANRDAWLRQLPVLWSNPPAKFKTIPTYSESEVRGPTESKFNDALDCAVLYYLTQDPKYAQCAADILHNAVKTLLPVAPSTEVGNGGWIIQNDLLKEARVMGCQLPVAYDFLHPWLQTNQVYDVQTGGLVNFSSTNAQIVFRTYYQLCRDHGSKDNNWSALMATCMLNSLLALDSASERAAALQVYLTTGSSRQASLDYDYRNYPNPGDIWPESLQYSSAVGSIRTYHMVLIERYDPVRDLFAAYPNFPLSLPRISQLRYPNTALQISFGDGDRPAEDPPYLGYELVYQHSLARGRTNLTSLFGGLINGGVSAGEYNRSTLNDYQSLGMHNEPLELLWNAPTVSEPGVGVEYPRSDALPWAGITLQRNPSPAGNATYGLMCFVGGSRFVHSHASGMNMELFGLGQVMGAKAGSATYGTAIHEKYYRLFSAANTIVVNGASRGEGGWAGIDISPVQNVAMEPQPFAGAVSSNFSFTCSSFADTNGSLTDATQQRTLSIVRTSPTNGFYVDFFRSKSTVTTRVATTLNGNVTNQFHDYIYHNIGSTNVSLTTNGVTLPLFSQPNRFQNDIGDAYEQPGWRYFSHTMVSYPHGQPVRAQFNATPSVTMLYTDMILPAVTNREYARVSSPPILDYSSADSPALVVRQIGDAWDKPFAVVYEPHFSASGSTVTNVTALWRANTLVGMKIENVVGGSGWVHYVLSNPSADQTYSDNTIGLSFTGRFGIIADSGNGTVALYLGQGKSLAYRGNSVVVAGNTNSQAEVQFTPGQTPVVSANAPVNVVSASAPVFMQISRQPTGVVWFTATGAPGVPYTLWGSTNLASGVWTALSSDTVTTSPFAISDSGAVANSTRFYRFTTP